MIDWLDEFRPPEFPDTSRALEEPEGLLAAGGHLSPAWLDCAYRKGIFPWNDPDEARLWWTPMPRAVILPETFRIPKRIAREVRNTDLRVTANLDFKGVIKGCMAPRADSEGTWIDDEIIDNYPRLHNAGRAISIECWDKSGALCGGFYGLSIGRILFGESMFTQHSGASKVAFATAAPLLFELGFEMIDCQMRTSHLERFGIIELDRPEFESRLLAGVNKPAPPSLPGVLK
jgi:leucyl/phenylalanyl-tRNA--protein transferase